MGQLRGSRVQPAGWEEWGEALQAAGQEGGWRLQGEAWGDSLGLCLGPMGCRVGRGLEWSEWQQLPWEAKWLRGSDRTWQDGFGGGEGAV